MKRSEILDKDWRILRRASLTLQRWGEDLCNGKIKEEEPETFRLYRLDPYGYFTIPGPTTKDGTVAPLKRALEIASKYGAYIYHQEDPRGCALYIYRPEDLREGQRIDSCYSLCALACC